MALVPDPYFINIELFWPNGTKPTASEISVVKASDVYNAVVTEEGQSGFNGADGGWQPVYMQNRAAFFPPRERPNLRFQVVSTQNEVLHTTQVFNNIAHNSTVRIVIGQSDELVGDTWRVGGQIHWPSGTPITNGTVRAYDVTNGSEALLGTTSIGPTGSYVLVYDKSLFQNNGAAHQNPNLQVKVYDPTGMLLKASEIKLAASNNEVVDLVLEAPVQPGKYRVFGTVTNDIGLPVSGVLVQAFNVSWTTTGITEVPLGAVLSDGKGDYLIEYTPQIPQNPLAACAAPDEIHLLVYAKDGTVASPGSVLSKAPPVSPAAKEERVDLVVDKASSATTSEYSQIATQLAPCETNGALTQMGERDDYLAIASQTTGIGYDLLRAYVHAHRLVDKINSALSWTTASQKLEPQVIFALICLGRGASIEELIQIEPAAFHENMVLAIERGIIDRSLEALLDPAVTNNLQDKWSDVLAYYLGDNADAWQTILLKLVISAAATRKTITKRYYAHEGSVLSLFDELAGDSTISAQQAEDLRFVFELYQAVDQYVPIVKQLYAFKNSFGWHTVADLAKVTLEAVSTVRGWVQHALEQTGFGSGALVDNFPGDIPGRDVDEKAHAYAQRLYDKFGKKAPEVRFIDDAKKAATSGSPLESAANFVAEHDGFSLATTGIDKYLSDNEIELDDEVVDKLKQLQRVQRLTSSFEAATALINAGLDSAVKIARIEEGQFIASYEDVLGLTEARAIHRKAKQYATEVFSTIVRFHQNLNDVGGSQVMPMAFSAQAALEETVSTGKKFPNWVTLFGSLYNVGSAHCQTVLSPGAYLVDLLDNFLTPTVRDLLMARRPDLADIELTCANTERAVPYIDLVNEVLGAVVAARVVPMTQDGTAQGQPLLLNQTTEQPDEDDTGEILELLRGAGYSLSENVVVRRSALATKPDAVPHEAVWVVEDASWRFTIRRPDTTKPLFVAYAAPQTSEGANELDVFPEHANEEAQGILADALFPLSLPLALGREEIELILGQRGTSRGEVLETLRSSTDESAKLADADLALAYLGLTAQEGQAILANVSSPEVIRKYWGMCEAGDADCDSADVSVPRPESPNIRVSGPWRQVLAEVSIFLHRAELKYSELLELLDTEFVHDPSAKLELDADDDDLQEGNYYRFRLLNLSDVALRRISFFLRLQRKLGWSMRELDRFLAAFAEHTTGTGAYALIPSDFVRVAQVVRLGHELKRPVSTLAGYFRDLDLLRTKRNPKSAFDEVYLRGAAGSDEYQGLNDLALGQQLDLTSANLAGYRSYVRGALRLNAADFEELWLQLGPVLPTTLNASVPLTVEQLSAMYRHADFCRALGVSVKDFFVAKALLGIEPFPSGAPDILATFAAIRELRRLQASGISARLWTYLLKHEAPVDEAVGPTAEETAEVHRRIARASAEILARYPNVDAPGSEILGPALGEMLSADKVSRILDILRQAEAMSVADKSFVTEAFGFFLGAGAQAFVDALPSGASAQGERLKSVWGKLRPYLVERARRDAALTVASDLFTARREIVDALLVRALDSVTTVGAPAKDDWIAGLRGFNGSDESIVSAEAGSWEASWVVPADGAYSLIARVNFAEDVVDEEVALWLDGAKVTVEPPREADSGTGKAWYRFNVGERKAGSVVSMRLVFTDVEPDPNAKDRHLTLFVQRDEQDPAILTAADVSSLNEHAYLKLWKALVAVRGLKLTTNELDYLIERHTLLDQLPLRNADAHVLWSSVRGFLDELAVNRSVSLDQTTLFDVWRTWTDELSSTAAAKLTGWDQDDIEAVRNLWSTTASLKEPDTWLVLRASVELAKRLDLRVSQLLDLVVAEPTASRASTLRSALRSKYSVDAWRSAFKPLRDKLRQRERDALVGYLTTHEVTVGSQKLFFVDANDLFAYFLIDVEMEPDTEISRIRLALNSVQLFVQRVLMGLETRSALTHLERIKDQWTWMQNYRVWEANRKVFLFPENWIEPELRDDKTELFRELEEELLQDDITGERAETALAGYLEKMAELSSLLVVGGCSEGRFAGGTTNVLHVVARTRTKPFTYYHRTFQGSQLTDGAFTPWQRIPLEIDAETVAPAVVEGSLRIFWPMVTMKDKVVTGSQPSDLGSQAEIRLMWSTLETKSGRWSKPRLGQSKVFDTQPVTVFARAPEDDGPDTRYYHFRTASEVNGEVKVLVYKTRYPDYKDGSLKPQLLDIFKIGLDGQEEVVPSGGSTIGENWPANSVLTRNAAAQLINGITIEGTKATTEFGLLGSVPFFSSGVWPFRAMVPNFGYLKPAENQPFFVEMPGRNLFALHRGTKAVTGFSMATSQTAHFYTFNHPQISELKQRLRGGGLPGLMNRLTQALPAATGRYYYNYNSNYLSSSAGSYASGYSNKYNYYGSAYLGYHIAGDRMAWGIAQRDFESEMAPSVSVERPLPLPTVEFGYGMPCAIYNWELFFHLPMLIADRFGQEMRFEDAMKWFHCVFDPRQELNRYEKTKRFPDNLPAGARYWNFLPFFANKDATDTLLDVFGVKEGLSSYEKRNLARVIDDWRKNPFSPHLIARQRITAYQKFVVMKYLDNLIGWGDQLFRRDTIEAINQATQLYVLAAEILGQRPEVIEPLTTEPRYTYRELQAKGISDFANSLVEVESLLVTNGEHVEGKDVDAVAPETQGVQATALLSLYFRVPRNEKLDGYWDKVQDRLFKIRNSMSIDGVKRSLALFEPPIDPALLVRARAAGLDLGTVLSQLSRPLPAYRFNVWNQKAMDLVNELKSFGGALLSALEKADAEELSQLRQSQEVRMQQLVRKVREDQVREAEQNVTALRQSRQLAEDRLQDYSSRQFMSGSETASLSLSGQAAELDTIAGVMNTVAGAVGVIPQFNAGAFSAGTEFGGLHLNGLFSAIASSMNVQAGVLRSAGGKAGTIAGYERRQEDWALQIRQAQLEIAQNEQQVIAAEIRAEIARKELANHELAMEQAEEVRTFLQEKFTNRELYQWMVSQLSRTYQDVYKLTYDVAKTAERAFQFELGVQDTSFIQFAYMDSLRQGLLAGEKLAYDVKRMDVAYLERNRRELELTKPISLAAINPEALRELREKGSCELSLPEVLFDLDHPGQYFRRIRAVKLSIPCVTGPYTSVSAKLSLLGSAIRVAATTDPLDYPYKGYDDTRFVHDVGGIQSIATSTAQDDAGLFELNFRDERYLPFEGAGAISRWRLELPEKARQFDYETISDVVITVSYTARDAGGSLKLGATNSIVNQLNDITQLITSEEGSGLYRVLSMKREFPDALHQMLTSESTTLKLLPEHFPYLLRQQKLKLTLFGTAGKFRVQVVPRGTLPVGPTVTFNDGPEVVLDANGEGEVTRGTDPLLDNWQPEEWTLGQQGLSSETVDDILLIVKYQVA